MCPVREVTLLWSPGRLSGKGGQRGGRTGKQPRDRSPREARAVEPPARQGQRVAAHKGDPGRAPCLVQGRGQRKREPVILTRTSIHKTWKKRKKTMTAKCPPWVRPGTTPHTPCTGHCTALSCADLAPPPDGPRRSSAAKPASGPSSPVHLGECPKLPALWGRDSTHFHGWCADRLDNLYKP